MAKIVLQSASTIYSWENGEFQSSEARGMANIDSALRGKRRAIFSEDTATAMTKMTPEGKDEEKDALIILYHATGGYGTILEAPATLKKWFDKNTIPKKPWTCDL